MNDENHNFFQELLRRRVFRAAATYIFVSWLIIQVASIILPEFDAPWWAMRALITLLVAGFPLTVMVAWTVDITTKGIVRTADTPHPRTTATGLKLITISIATLMSAGVIWWAWTGYIEPTTRKPSRAAIKTNPVVAVDAPKKLAGNESLDWLGNGIANLIRAELSESRHVIVLSPSRWADIAATAETPDQLPTLAKNAGIDYLITGDYLQSPSGIVLTTRTEDIAAGIEISGSRLQKSDAASVIAAASEVSLRIKRALKIPHQRNVERFTADFAVENMEAYEAYVAGLEYLIDFDYQEAEDSFTAALTLAPDFHIARYRLASVMEATGRAQLAHDELDAIPIDALLTERERLYIEGAKARFTIDRDPLKSIEIYSQLVEKYPYEMEAGQHLADAYWLDFQEDVAIEQFRRLVEVHPHEPSAWMALGERLLDVGELDEARKALTRYASMEPDDHYAEALLGKLAQLQRQIPLSIEHYNRSLELKPDFTVAVLGLARSLYIKSDFAKADEQWRSLLLDKAAAAGFRIDAAFDLTGVMRGQGRFQDALEPLTTVRDLLRDEGLRDATAMSVLGSTQMEMGNEQVASAMIAAAIQHSPGVATRHLFARGVMELRNHHVDQLQNTIAEIQALALPPRDPDRTEDKAAIYLAGLASLQRNDLAAATEQLLAAVSMEGYQYAIYKIGLAELYFAKGDSGQAATLAAQAASERLPGDLRLDLELDRNRALLLHAEILADMGATASAREQAQAFIDRWQFVADDLPELRRARELIALH